MCVEAVGVADVRAAVAIIVEVGVVGGRGGFHRCLGYVVIKLLCVAEADGGCDGCEKDGEGDETDNYEYAGFSAA